MDGSAVTCACSAARDAAAVVAMCAYRPDVAKAAYRSRVAVMSCVPRMRPNGEVGRVVVRNRNRTSAVSSSARVSSFDSTASARRRQVAAGSGRCDVSDDGMGVVMKQEVKALMRAGEAVMARAVVVE